MAETLRVTPGSSCSLSSVSSTGSESGKRTAHLTSFKKEPSYLSHWLGEEFDFVISIMDFLFRLRAIHCHVYNF